MKNLIIAVFVIFLISGLASCVKPMHCDPGMFSATIKGKWGIKNDSVVSGVGPNVTGTNYIGTDADYFDFRDDNNVYIKEGARLDTSAYQLVTDSTIIINKFGISFNGVPETSRITALTSTSATIFTPFLVNPGAYYLRTVNLKR
jgi:hypothetical protein